MFSLLDTYSITYCIIYAQIYSFSVGFYPSPFQNQLFWAYGEKTDPGHCPEQQLFAQRPSMINRARGGLLSGKIPGILNICAHCEPIARCAVDFHAQVILDAF